MKAAPKKSQMLSRPNRGSICSSQEPQPKLFSAETTWFHIFRTMISNGDMARMGPYAFAVYCVIKAHANINDGDSFPEHETIAVKARISPSQVKRSIEKLKTMGYVSVEKKGRNNHYTLREKIEINDQHGRPQAVATWDYLPSGVKGAMTDLQGVIHSGDFGGARIVHIERLVVNMNTGSGTQINLDISGITDPQLRRHLESLLAKAHDPGVINLTDTDQRR